MVVADLTALIALNTAVLPNNQQVWVVAENANYYLDKTSERPIDSPLVVETDAGAGAPGRWIQGIALADPCTPDDPFGNCICVPPGEVAESLLYWDGADPVWLTPGTNGQVLQIAAGLLTWGSVPAGSIAPGPADTMLWSDGVTAQWSADPVLSGSIGLGASPRAATGYIRVPHGATSVLVGRNSTNTNDVGILRWGTSSNRLTIGSSSVALVYFDSPTFSIGNAFPVSIQFVNNVNGTGAKFIAASTSFTVRSEGFSAGVNQNGLPLLLQGGRRTGSGFRGAVRLQWNADDATFQAGVELANVVADNRVVSLAFGADLTSTQMPASTGDLVVFLGNAASVPSADPVSGITMYSDTARPAWRWATANSIRMNGVSATANTGAAGAPPAQVAGYLDWQVNGTQRKIPYYAA